MAAAHTGAYSRTSAYHRGKAQRQVGQRVEVEPEGRAAVGAAVIWQKSRPAAVQAPRTTPALGRRRSAITISAITKMVARYMKPGE